MTDNDSSATAQTSGAGGRGSSGFGKSAVFAAGGVAVLLAALLIPSGIGVARALTVQPSATATLAPSNSETGAQTPVADSSALPDRSSDPTSAPSASPTPEDTIYDVQPGDTLTSISARLGMSVDSIAAYNAVRNVDVISSGSVLRVPYIYVPPTTGVESR